MPTGSPPPLWRARAVNAWRDLRASAAGFCNASAWRVARENPVEWRCARPTGHLGLHRHGAFRWDDTGRLYRDLISEPAVYQPRSRYAVLSVRQARLLADPEARRLAAEAMATAANLTVSARVQVARPAAAPGGDEARVRYPARRSHAAPDWPAFDGAAFDGMAFDGAAFDGAALDEAALDEAGLAVPAAVTVTAPNTRWRPIGPGGGRGETAIANRRRGVGRRLLPAQGRRSIRPAKPDVPSQDQDGFDSEHRYGAA
jgi:hypothetical protein